MIDIHTDNVIRGLSHFVVPNRYSLQVEISQKLGKTIRRFIALFISLIKSIQCTHTVIKSATTTFYAANFNAYKSLVRSGVFLQIFGINVFTHTNDTDLFFIQLNSRQQLPLYSYYRVIPKQNNETKIITFYCCH